MGQSLISLAPHIPALKLLQQFRIRLNLLQISTPPDTSWHFKWKELSTEKKWHYYAKNLKKQIFLFFNESYTKFMSKDKVKYLMLGVPKEHNSSSFKSFETKLN